MRRAGVMEVFGSGSSVVTELFIFPFLSSSLGQSGCQGGLGRRRVTLQNFLVHMG
jgi:hypothetical protein